LGYTWISSLKGIHWNGNVLCLLLVWKWGLYIS
jgi:hypothetical protein